MVVRFKKCVLKIDEISKDEISLESFLDHEQEVLRLILWWKTNEATIQFKTSGSTGKPKSVEIPRWKIEYSAKATMKRLDPHSKFRTALLCINPSMIGGAMVVFRSLCRGLDLTVIPPSSDPSLELDKNETFDLVSMVPIQMYSTKPIFWNRFHSILVGGADFQPTTLDTAARLYHTFGMTETVSHFALKQTGQNFYECIGDIELSESPDQRLQIRGTLTDNQWLETNDIIQLISSTRFRWKGRADFVINSGGVKINPEVVESKLRDQIHETFIVASIPDDRLGNKVVLILEGEVSEMSLDYSSLSPYEKPKEFYFLPKLCKTPSLKIDRVKTQRLLQQKLDSSKN